MVQVTCEKTGIVFEAKTRRTKNHPTVQGWFATAYEEGWYTEANNAVYGPNKQKFETIEQFVAYFEKLQKETLGWKEEEAKRERERKAQREEAKRERYITNGILSNHGYKWVNLGYPDDEEIDNAALASGMEFPRNDWQLFSSDDRAVTIVQAMQEIAATGNQNAKNWLAERGK